MFAAQAWRMAWWRRAQASKHDLALICSAGQCPDANSPWRLAADAIDLRYGGVRWAEGRVKMGGVRLCAFVTRLSAAFASNV